MTGIIQYGRCQKEEIYSARILCLYLHSFVCLRSEVDEVRDKQGKDWETTCWGNGMGVAVSDTAMVTSGNWSLGCSRLLAAPDFGKAPVGCSRAKKLPNLPQPVVAMDWDCRNPAIICGFPRKLTYIMNTQI
jgi:hypothetical protein